MSNSAAEIRYVSSSIISAQLAVDGSEDVGSSIASSLDLKASRITIIPSDSPITHLIALSDHVALRQSHRNRYVSYFHIINEH